MNIRFQDNKRVFGGCDPTDTIEEIASYTHYTAYEVCKLVDTAILDSEQKKYKINTYELPFDFCSDCPFKKLKSIASYYVKYCDNEPICRFVYDEVKE